MPLTTIHLLSLCEGRTIADAARKLSALKPLVIARAVRWIIKPEKLSVSELLDPSWDLFVVLPEKQKLSLPDGWIKSHWSITAGIPSRLVDGFVEKNQHLLHPASVPALTGSLDNPRKASSAQGLELSDELLEWSKSLKQGKNAVSMFNLLAFKPGSEESYKNYGKAFAESIGSRRGGNAKLVGKVVDKQNDAGWDEIALAQYPSIAHFTDMLASQDYQAVNHKYRLPSLRDTCILCTTELDPEILQDRAKL